MHTRLLIDSIMRQTTVLVAQLSAAAGIRAPMSHIVDEVFLSLSKELEDQGVSRKVVADMFGLALRSYQRRVHRLRESVTEQGTTLWQAVLETLQEGGPTTRQKLFERFEGDDPEVIGAILSDLVRGGLVSRTGTGNSSVFSPAPEETRRLLARQGKVDTAMLMVWLDICRHGGCSASEVAERLALEIELVEEALAQLRREGRLTSDEGEPLEAEAFVIPVGAEAGWEAAVFDHFQACATAIGAKLRLGQERSEHDDTTGGATLSFEISQGHPLAAEVRGQLARIRAETDELWERVEAFNAERPVPEDEVERVVLYFGQFVKAVEN